MLTPEKNYAPRQRYLFAGGLTEKHWSTGALSLGYPGSISSPLGADGGPCRRPWRSRVQFNQSVISSQGVREALVLMKFTAATSSEAMLSGQRVHHC